MVTRDEVIQMAREAGINGIPAKIEGGVDDWFGDQYLPCGSLKRLVEIASRRQKEKCIQACLEVATCDEKSPAESFVTAVRNS